MNAAEPETQWGPDLEPEWPPYEATFPISDDVRYVQKLGFDVHQRLVEWAVVQMCREGDQWRRVAVYDICHQKGVHLHLYDQQETEFTEQPLRPVSSYKDIETGLDYALERVIECWHDNDRRWRRGY